MQDALVDHVAISWYNLFIDGVRTAEGPTRFTGQAPYFERTKVTLAAGEHVIAIHAHSAGVQTRTLLLRPPAVFCRVTTTAGAALPVAWLCRPLSAGAHSALHSPAGAIPLYKVQWNRISTLLGWAEDCSVSSDYAAWPTVSYKPAAGKWKAPLQLDAEASYQPPLPLESVAAPASSVAGAALGAMAKGQLWNRYGYVDDDPPARSFLRKLVADTDAEAVAVADPVADNPDIPGDDYGPAQGRWWRFDLGKCRLTRLDLTVNAPAGVVFEVSYAQELLEGRVSPWMTLCGSTSCYLDRYTIGADMAGKDVKICPLEPRGCRYIEVHGLFDALPIQPDPAAFLAQIKLIEAVPLFRGYSAMQASPGGAWHSDDALLNRIWTIGIETTRSCTEDTAIDGPCRERGQWTGDTLAVTLQNVTACYSDVRALKLCLTQASSTDGVDKNGMISGNCPENTYPLDYVCIWFTGAVAYYEATGDKPLMSLLFPRAKRAMDFMVSKTTVAGLATKDTGCGQVVDWGYQPPPACTTGGIDITMNCFYLQALKAMVTWCTALGEDGAKYAATHGAVSKALSVRLQGKGGAAANYAQDISTGSESDDGWVVVEQEAEPAEPEAEPVVDLAGLDWSTIGYHAAAVALAAGLLGPPPSSPSSAITAAQSAAIAFIKSHLAGCFPNDRTAPRAANPSCANPKLYTPYYATFSFPAMIAYGELDWVLGQYRSAWGWAATQSSTWLEVFDGRWEKVHSWSGCPTWQLSAYTLGLTPRCDVGARHFDLKMYAAESLLKGPVAGRVPCREGDAIAVTVAWKKTGSGEDGGGDAGGADSDLATVQVVYTVTTSPSAGAVFVSGWGGAAAGAWTEIHGTKTCTLTLPVSSA